MTSINIITFNLRGLKLDDIRRLTNFLDQHKIDIALFQETHIQSHTEARMFHEALTSHHHATWRTFWHNDHSKQHARGISTWVRTSREQREDIQIIENSIQKRAGGRLLLLTVQWSGHRIRLGNVYMPTASTANYWEQRKLIVQQLAIQTHRAFVCAGDWNMVEDAQKDTTSKVRQHNLNERNTVKFFQATLGAVLEEPHKVDLQEKGVFTHLQNTIHGQVRSRLDRFYMSADVTRYVHKMTRTLETHNYGLRSDHKPVCLELLGKTPYQPKPSPPQHMRAVKLSAKFDRDMLEQARREFRQRIGQLHEGIWTSEEIRNSIPDQQRYTQILQDYPKIKQALTRVWEKYSGKTLQRKRQALQEAHGQHHHSLEKECLQELEQCQQANQTSSKLCIPNDHMDRLAGNLLRKPKQLSQIGMLVDPASGFQHTTPQGIANCMIKTITAVSKARPGSLPHQQELLDLITPEERQIFPQHCDDSAIIQPEEVLKAFRRVRQSCPGDDGLKIEHYRKFKNWMAPALAELFTAMLHMDTMPKGFHDSTIRAIPKPGNPCNPQNYRPISLTNVDYRIFGFILKERMITSLQHLIPDTQTAFLPGRQSAQNIWILQALQQRLEQEDKQAIHAVCDFRKAYDTISRPFLLQVCMQLKMPAYMQRWIGMLLRQTRGRVFVNNCFSDYQYFEAGLRQGCPASPALYLLIGFMLSKLVESTDMGISLKSPFAIKTDANTPQQPDDKICLLQYADDSKLVLQPDQLPTFNEVMGRFALATGQHLNQEKTHLLPIGKVGRQRFPTRIHGYKVTSEAKVLGVTLRSGNKPPTYDWKAKMASLTRQTAIIQRMTGLSTFAKYDLFNKFVVSQILYAAEFINMPDHIEAGIQQLARQLLPLGATCWTKEGQQCKAQYGGLGLMPIKEHIAARRAKWTIKLILQGTSTLWTRLLWNTVYVHRRRARSSKSKEISVAASLLTNPPPLPNLLMPSRHLTEIDECSIQDIIEAMLQGRKASLDPSPHWILGSRRVCSISAYSVKEGTKMLMTNGDNPRQWIQPIERQASFVYDLCNMRPTIGMLARCKRQWWKARLPNKWKEPAWHATMKSYMVDHVNEGARKTCACGHRHADTLHHCRDCAIATHIYGLLQPENIFPHTSSHFQQLLFNIWTNAAPPDFPHYIWTIISLITIYAIDIGRRTAYRLKNHPRTKQATSNQRIVTKAQGEAEAFFWNTLGTSKATFPHGQEDTPNLPFLEWDHQASVWRLKKPTRWMLRT